MRMPLVSRILFCLVSVYLVVGAHIADYSRTHLFDPRWPPHAKFHDGQTLMFSILLAALTILFALRRTEDKMNSLIATTSFAALYWVTQALAIVYPGTAFVDPEFKHSKRLSTRAACAGHHRHHRSVSHLCGFVFGCWQVFHLDSLTQATTHWNPIRRFP